VLGMVLGTVLTWHMNLLSLSVLFCAFTVTRVHTDIKTMFSRTSKDQIPGFSRTQKTCFQGLSSV